MPRCIMWCIWQERNAISFESCERSILEIKSFFLSFFARVELSSTYLFKFFSSYYD